MPPDPPIEAYTFGSRLGKRSVFILDPRLESLDRSWQKWKLTPEKAAHAN